MSRHIVLAALVALVLGFAPSAFAASVCPNPLIGTTCTFHAHEFTFVDPGAEDVTATCRAVGQRIYVFVADSQWNDGKVTQDHVDRIVTHWETSVPSDPLNGIYHKIRSILNVEVPNLFDRDDRIYLVIHDIKSTPLNPVTAYFRPIDYQKSGNNPMPGANGHEVLFLHWQSLDSDQRRSDLTYVFTDMLHHVIDPGEVAWARDVIARRMALEMGYTAYLSNIRDFSNNPGQSLLGDVRSDRVVIYPGVTTLFGVYLSERFTIGLWGDWAYSPLSGRDGLEFAMSFSDPGLAFCQVLHDFSLTNGLNRGAYRYQTYNLPRFQREATSAVADGEVTREMILQSFAAVYLDIDLSDLGPDDELELELSFPDAQEIQGSVALFSTQQDGGLNVRELPLQAGQSSRVLFERPAANYNHALIVLSRCAAADPMVVTVTTTATSPPVEDGDGPDGDSEDGDDSDGDEPQDGDEPSDGDSGDGDGDGPDSIISGTKSCAEIHACYTACKTDLCRRACVEDGTEEGQQHWDDFLYCIEGKFRGGVNCLDLGSAAERERCMSGQCPIQYEACRIPDVDDGLPADSDGGGCRHGQPAPLALLLALAFWGLRRRQTSP